MNMQSCSKCLLEKNCTRQKRSNYFFGFGTYCLDFKQKIKFSSICIGNRCIKYKKCVVHEPKNCIEYIKLNMCPMCIYREDYEFCGVINNYMHYRKTIIKNGKCDYVKKELSIEDGVEKPPLGIIPEKLWKENRIKQLVKAVNEWIDYSHIEKWCEEIIKLIEELK